MNDITLKLSTPSRTIRNDKVYRVTLPSVRSNLTVIKDRAPTSIFFQNGVASVLDSNGNATDRYFLMAGVADIKDNFCNVSSEMVIPFKDITLAQAKEKGETAPSESLKDFYNMIQMTLSNLK